MILDLHTNCKVKIYKHVEKKYYYCSEGIFKVQDITLSKLKQNQAWILTQATGFLNSYRC